MNPEKFDLSKLRIASPCSVDWNNMHGNDRTRFCESCELSVYNVAGMTANEIRILVASTDGRLCMRLRRRADGTVITKDCPVGLRGYQKRVARFLGAAMAAVLGLFSISYGQKEDKDTIDASKLKIVHVTNDCSGEITGTIMDAQGAVIQRAEITVFEGSKGEKRKLAAAVSNDEGEFRVPHLPKGRYELTVSSNGFRLLTVGNIVLSEVECLKMDLTMTVAELMGVVVTVDEVEAMPSSIPTTINTRKNEDF